MRGGCGHARATVPPTAGAPCGTFPPGARGVGPRADRPLRAFGVGQERRVPWRIRAQARVFAAPWRAVPAGARRERLAESDPYDAAGIGGAAPPCAPRPGSREVR